MPEQVGTTSKYFPADKDLFPEGGDAWLALNAGREVTIKEGFIIDVWDPVSKKLYDLYGNEIGTRETSYFLPTKVVVKDLSDEELATQMEKTLTEIESEKRALRPQQSAFFAKYRILRAIKKEKAKREGKWTPPKLKGLPTGFSGAYNPRWT